MQGYLVADAGSLPVPGASRDVVGSGLFLNFPPVPEAVLAAGAADAG